MTRAELMNCLLTSKIEVESKCNLTVYVCRAIPVLFMLGRLANFLVDPGNEENSCCKKTNKKMSH